MNLVKLKASRQRKITQRAINSAGLILAEQALTHFRQAYITEKLKRIDLENQKYQIETILRQLLEIDKDERSATLIRIKYDLIKKVSEDIAETVVQQLPENIKNEFSKNMLVAMLNNQDCSHAIPDAVIKCIKNVIESLNFEQSITKDPEYTATYINHSIHVAAKSYHLSTDLDLHFRDER